MTHIEKMHGLAEAISETDYNGLSADKVTVYLKVSIHDYHEIEREFAGLTPDKHNFIDSRLLHYNVGNINIIIPFPKM